MSEPSRLKRLWGGLMRIGDYPGESDALAGRRRIVVGYIVFGTPPRLIAASRSIVEGLPLYAMVDLLAAAVPAIGLVFLAVRPRWFVGIVNVLLAASLLENLVPTVMFGGILEADFLIAFSILTVIGALIALDRRAGFLWFLAALASFVLAAVLPGWIDPLYDAGPPAVGDIVFTLVGVAVFSYAGMAYFVRQRDRFQRESDDLLHNILPDDIATRLKARHSMIADDHEAASVLFADVVGFTPMSAGMSPPELVGLLNNVFTTFDGFVEELGLEKIKTVGDEYMAAAGVPHPRPDHAHAAAELALRMRDHCAQHRFDGHDIRLRIGLNSGPVVAGIVGTHKFAYDLWGDVVNTASRMESEGVAGSIQISAATHELIRDTYDCAPRGTIDVKGKGEMETYFLLERRDGQNDAALADAPEAGEEPAGQAV
jgi:guanylate cyclase